MSYKLTMRAHQCKLCLTCLVCHNCLKSRASIFRANTSDPGEGIRDLFENSARTHFQDPDPQYIIVGPDNEKIAMTPDGLILSVTNFEIKELCESSDDSIADENCLNEPIPHSNLENQIAATPGDVTFSVAKYEFKNNYESSDDSIVDENCSNEPISNNNSSSEPLSHKYLECQSDEHSEEDEPISLGCSVCSKTFSNKRDLEIHLIYHSTEEVHKCKVCGMLFEYSYELIKHSLNHKNPNNVCEFCKKEFRTTEKLRIHVASHTGEYPVSCVVCDRGFKDYPRLKSHLLCHTEDKPFVCDKCGKGFRRKSQLRTHSWVHSEVKPFSCEFCEKPFNYKCNLRLHVQRTHMIYDVNSVD